jgi:hypothetical protein
MADHRLTVTLTLSLTLFALTFAGLSALANQESTHSADPAALGTPDPDGFITLFNGHDLSGWSGLSEYWSVDHGSSNEFECNWLHWNCGRKGEEPSPEFIEIFPQGNRDIDL